MQRIDRKGGEAHGHARFMLEKRQRVVTTAVDTDEDATTTALARGRQPLAATTTITAADDDVDTPVTTSTSAARGRARVSTSTTAAAIDTVDTSAALPTLPLTRGILATATSAVATSTSTSTTPSTASTSASTPTTSARTITATPSSLSRTPTSSVPTSSVSQSSISVSSGIAAVPNSQSKDATSDSSSGGGHAGAIAGAIIAILAVAAIAAFFGLRYRKKKRQAAEDAAIFPYGGNNPNAGNGNAGGLGASTGAGAFGKRQSAGYSQQIDSFDDLPASNNNNGNAGYYGEKEMTNANNNEKIPSSGMAGYGTLSLNGGGGAGGGMNNFAGRGSGFSASNASLLGRDGAPLQPGAFVSPPVGGQQDRFSNGWNNEYPPTPLQNINNHGSIQSFNSIGRPSAAMMSHPDDPLNRSANHLPAHQDLALSAALAAATTVPLPKSPVPSNNNTATRQSMNSVATAAAAAALAGNGNEEPQQGPFEDPNHEGKLYVVTRIFEPSMPDELVIFPGDRIQIVVTYDDGWCLGCNLDSPKRDGKPPARGVFPVDCVEELVDDNSPASRPSSQQPTSNSARNSAAAINEDEPIGSGAAILHRAPTLPMLDMGISSRFSMGSSPASRQSEEQKRMSKRQSTPLQQQQAPTVEEAEDEETDDAYGGVAAATSATPTHTAFPPDIQVSQPAVNRTSHHFGSSQHIADYASQLDSNNNSNKRLSTLDEENSQILDEFPSTPRTAQANSPMSFAASPAGSEARLSVAGIPKSSSSKSLNRTSSLIASKDADLFLAFGDALDKNEK